jgi:hypothetical protein
VSLLPFPPALVNGFPELLGLELENLDLLSIHLALLVELLGLDLEHRGLVADLFRLAPKGLASVVGRQGVPQSSFPMSVVA